MSASSEPLLFADLLRRYRLAAGLTQSELAHAAGLGVRGVSDLERGVRTSPRADTVRLLADALGLGEPERAAFLSAARRPRHPARSPTRAVRQTPSPTPNTVLPPLVGRASELAQIKRLLVGDGPPILLLAGEPGIGKSRLLHEAATCATALGWRVLADGCHRRSGQEAYAPVVGALARCLTERSPAQQRRDLQGCAWLARLLPELGDSRVVPVPTWMPSPERERRVMFAAVRRFLANVAGSSGTLLLLDDLQWAGADALDLLVTLVRAECDTPLRVMGAYRNTEVRAGAALAETLADLARDGLVEKMTLASLSREESAALLADMLHAMGRAWSAELAARVVRRTGGVPFFLVSCAQSLPDGAVERETTEIIPWNVSESIRQRVATLPGAAQEALQVAAVAGRTIPRALLIAVARQAAREDEAVVRALEEASRVRLLLTEDGADAYAFVHDLIHEVVAADLSLARRKSLHLRLAEAQERMPPLQQRAAELAWHFQEAGEGARALSYLLLAGDRAVAVHACAEAEPHYRAAIELASRVGDLACVAETRMRLAQMFLGIARYEDARAQVEGGAAAYRACDDRAGLERVAAQRVLINVLGETAEQTAEQTQCALESLETSLTPRHAVDLYAAILHHYHVTGKHREIIPFAANRITSLPRTARDNCLLAQSFAMAGYSLLFTGSSAEALRTAEEAIPLCQATGELSALIQMLHLASTVHLYMGDFVASRRYIEQADNAAERLGEFFGIAFVASARAHVAFFSGAWDEAWGYLERSIDFGRQAGFLRPLMYPLIELGRMRLVRGAIGPARDALDEAIALTEFPREIPFLPWVQCLRAECELAEGNAAAARDRLAPLIAQFAIEEWSIIMALPTLVEAHMKLEEWIEADDLLMQGVACARDKGERLTLADLLRTQALLRVRQGRWQEAVDDLDESLALCRAMSYPYAEAKALYVSGQLHAAKGEPALAREQYAAALSICAQLGEGLYRPQIERALAALAGSAATS